MRSAAICTNIIILFPAGCFLQSLAFEYHASYRHALSNFSCAVLSPSCFCKASRLRAATLFVAVFIHTAYFHTCPDAETNPTGGNSRRRGRTQGLSASRLNPSSRRTSNVAMDGEGGGGQGRLSPESAAPGLTEAQFFGWLTEIVVECKALGTKKTFGHSLTRRPCSILGRGGRGYRGGKDDYRDPLDGASARRQNAARALALLQWMEVSRGMSTGKKGGGIPPFRLSACLANSMPL